MTTTSTVFLVILGVLTTPVLLFINWVLWFRVIPMLFRTARDQLRAGRDGGKPGS